jgi:hypothetical protein
MNECRLEPLRLAESDLAKPLQKMCPACKQFAERVSITHPDKYRAFSRKLTEVVNRGLFKLVKADWPPEDVFGAEFPRDSARYGFQCAMCARRFSLHVNTSGDTTWEIGPPRDTRHPVN